MTTPLTPPPNHDVGGIPFTGNPVLDPPRAVGGTGGGDVDGQGGDAGEQSEPGELHPGGPWKGGNGDVESGASWSEERIGGMVGVKSVISGCVAGDMTQSCGRRTKKNLIRIPCRRLLTE